MADNITTQSGTLATIPTGTPIGSDDIGGVQYQRVKIANGPDGVFNGDWNSWGATTSLISTDLNSLATSTTAGRASAEVDLTSVTPSDVAIVGKFTMTTAGSPTGLIEVYCLYSLDGTTYTGDTTYSGSAAAYSVAAAGSLNLTPLFYVKAHANTNAYQGGASIRSVLGFVPPWFALVIINNTAIALHSSGNDVSYRVRY